MHNSVVAGSGVMTSRGVASLMKGEYGASVSDFGEVLGKEDEGCYEVALMGAAVCSWPGRVCEECRC